MPRWKLFLALAAAFAGPASAAQDADLKARIRRGQVLYIAQCSMCHQVTGQGVPGVYPPLAKADFLRGHPERAIRAIVEGLSGKITVNGREYDGRMPAAVLNDQQAADVLTYVHQAWGNTPRVVTADEVQAVRAKSAFPTFEALVKANEFAPLPKPPEGLAVREVARLPDFGTRLASDGRGRVLYVLGQAGAVWRLEVATGQLRQILKAADYMDVSRGEPSTLGFTLDAQQRLWLVTNQRVEGRPFITNEVVILRSAAPITAEPVKLTPWFRTAYPFGIGPYNHGVSQIGFGPDGMLYLASGSRTDGGEAGTDPRYYTGGETDLTACLWRLDPNAETPRLEAFAHGLRNAYAFAWDDQRRLFTVSNGPDADAPEEMDFIEPGRHYGFPYQFADWKKKAYPHTPDAPPGLAFTPPVMNFGPDAGGAPDAPIGTFDPHSSPAGMAWLGDDWPEPWRGTFLVSRFGILLARPQDTGFDVVSVKLRKVATGASEAEVRTVLAPLGRPIDVHLAPGGRAFILEYTRPTNFKDQAGWLPGRVIELAVKK